MKSCGTFDYKSLLELILVCNVELNSLKKLHFISKIQSSFLKEKKNDLAEMECIVLADFAENITFVVQDETQSYHWVNKQATIYPFVITTD